MAFGGSVPASALDDYGIYDADEYLAELPEHAREVLTDDQIMDGTLDLNGLLSIGQTQLLSAWRGVISMLPGFLMIIILGVICSEFACMDPCGGMQATTQMVVGLLTFLYLLDILSELYYSVALSVEQLGEYGVTLSGVMGSFLVFGGNYAGVGAVLPFTVVLCSLLSFLARYIFPGVCAVLIVSSIAALGSGAQLQGAAKLISGTYFTVCTSVLSLLSLFVSFQARAASAADSVLRKGAKLASAYAIPVVGGVISESVDNITAGFAVLKSAFGLGAASVILLTVFPTALTVLLYKLLFALIGSFCDIAGAQETSRLLSGVDILFNVLLFTLVLAAIAYLYCLILFCSLESGL